MNDGRSQIVIEWMRTAQRERQKAQKTLSRLLSQADTDALMGAYELCFEIAGQPAKYDQESEVLVVLRKEIVTRGFERPLGAESDVRANCRPQHRH